MTVAQTVAGIATQYYKVACLQSVTYSIFTSKEPSPDQVLLELELQIRHEHPKILLTYNNKCLYYFRFGHWMGPNAGSETQNGEDIYAQTHHANLNLESLYPQLSLKQENSVSAEKLANPAHVTRKNANAKDDVRDEYLAYASLSFMKAVKKALIYNMAARGEMHLFGNYVVGRISQTSAQYRVIQIDPVLLGNGDLLASVTQRDKLPLFHSSVLNLDHVIPEFASCFVIYVIPSGLRCHLYDSHNLPSSFTTTPPKSSENLLRLLKSSTGVDLTEKPQILWVKLIPNLQHLNNQTSAISRFIHDVDNRKYILWPWELCVLQFGSVERTENDKKTPSSVDPMALIDDFLSFSLSVQDSASPTKQSVDPETNLSSVGSNVANSASAFPFNIPSALSGMGSADNDEKVPQTSGKRSVSDLFDLQNTENDSSVKDQSSKVEVPAENGEPPKTEGEADEDDDDDDLFGASSDSDSKETELPIEDDEKDEPIAVSDKTNGEKTENLDFDQDSAMDVDTIAPTNGQKSPLVSPTKGKANPEKSEVSTYLGIPKNEMISAQIREFTPGSYDDPGAPPPLIPTPAIPQTNTFNSHFPGYSAHGPPGHVTKTSSGARKDRRSSEPTTWAFSPIVFNPKIKNSIDTKYGRGGKFYVDTEESSGPESEPRKPRYRETSVSAYDLHVPGEGGQKPRTSESSSSVVDGNEDVPRKDREDHEYDIEEIEKEDIEKEVDKEIDSATEESDNDADPEDEDEESDEDEDMPVSDLNGTSLRLNTQDPFDPLPASGPLQEPPRVPGSAVSTQHPFSGMNSAHMSPGSGHVRATRYKANSPFGLGIESHNMSISPMPVLEMKTGVGSDVVGADISMSDPANRDVVDAHTPSSNSSTSSGVSESSNCLPLILRSINVQSIPNVFLLNKVPGAWGAVTMASGFDMDMEEEDDDIDHKDGGLFVRAKNMDELLNWLVPNLVFDNGLTDFEQHTQLKLPDFFAEDVVAQITDGSASPETAKAFAATFPSSYNVTLDELLVDTASAVSPTKAAPDLKGPLPFLDDIMSDHVAFPAIETAYWDSFYPKGNNGSETVKMGHSGKKVDDSAVFSFGEVKVKARKNNSETINLDFLGTRFWKYLNFEPVHGQKKFQVLMVAENSHDHFASSSELLDMVRYNYADMHLGSIKKLNLQTFETRPDLEGISNGVLMIDKEPGESSHSEFYKRANRKLKNLAELIKLDLINRTNRFEFDRPLLLLFIDFDESISSVLQIAKICRNFKVGLNNHQLALVEVFAHVIPASHLYKSAQNPSCGRCLRYLSDTKLAKISTLLYNKCPNTSADSKLTHDREEPRKLYSRLVKDPPSSLQFKFFNRQTKESMNTESHDDMFLHVAYERSVDKNWICAAWSDPLGIVTHMKSWYCPPNTKEGHDLDVHDLGSIICQIWDVSNRLFKRLNEDLSQRTCGSGKKKFLVLARVSSIIPDDELLYWKRLTAKYKDVSLVVLTTNRAPKKLFEAGEKDDSSGYSGGAESGPGFRVSHSEPFERKPDFIQSLDAFPAAPNSTSPSGSIPMSTSPMNNALTFHSPQQFLNAPSSIFLAPDGRDASFSDAESTLRDTSFDIVGVIPKVALPSCNSPTRYSMRTGYLVKEAGSPASAKKQYMVFEVSLLSCSNYWNLDTAMRITLNQFKKLIALGEILGVKDRAGARGGSVRACDAELHTLVPWHIGAVVKALDYLVHVHVEERG